MTKNEFIEKVNKKYGIGKYTVLGEYKNNKSKILIRCNTCGYEWEVRGDNFINLCRVGCPKCACKNSHDKAKLPTEELIKRGKDLYGDRYSYDKVDSLNRDENGRVCFTCNVCGEDFWESPSLFLYHKRVSSNCPNCAKKITERNIKLKEERHRNYLENYIHDTEGFVKKLNEKFPNFYDTSKTVYVNRTTNITLIHNGMEIITTPASVLSSKKPILKNSVTDTKSFIEKANQVHNNEYIYDEKTIYTNAHNKITVKCKKHGYFEVIANNHLNGVKCNLCRKETKINPKTKTFEEFLSEAIKKHSNKYVYDKSTFVNYRTKMRIICPIHGEFWQTPTLHIAGISGHGCPKCKESRLERSMRIILEENSIKYDSGKRFEWLGQQHLDFYLPDYNIGIECQGKQHFIEGGWNNDESLKLTIQRDRKKFEKSNGKIKMLYLLDYNMSKKNIVNNEKFGFIYNNKNTFRTKEQIIDFLKKI